MRMVVALNFLPPVFLGAIGYLLKQHGWPPLVPNYEEGVTRFIQYFLFAIGVGIFFFCDGLAGFIGRRVLPKSLLGTSDSWEAGKLLRGYSRYTVMVQVMMDLISISGFLGFLICSNLTWLVVFVILQLSIQWRFWPSAKRLVHLIKTLRQ
ncbi:MAG: hypothetical protein NC911_04740 [Candidatus Omnitrophica bacterium]|nr:hypothetical protein [Candidatus Omnitrophota bacterium]